MNVEGLSLEQLEDHVQSLAVAETPAEVFKALMEGARIAAPRTAIFLLKQSRLKGWGTVGYPPEVGRGQRQFSAPAEQGWFGEILRSERPVVRSGSNDPGYPDFGQTAAEERLGCAVRVKGRPIAVLVAERSNGELPWHPAVFGVLLRVAQLRLDLDLFRRKTASTPPPAPARATPVEAAAAGTTASETTVRTPTEPAEPTTSEPRPETVAEAAAAHPAPVASPSKETKDPKRQAAERYARLVATDIRLYNEDAVMQGQRDGDLVARLQESLMRGKETFLRRHGDLGEDGLRILHQAYVDVLADGRANLIEATVLA
jgi:hypothetical protein